ncbi:MAG: hypothetical protein LVS60_09225 [Nodosilinea sp. LVE1205-7]
MNILGKTAIARLALHQSQRCQAIPTLSVLQGKAITARQLWTQWSKQTERSTGVGVYTSIAALLETWLAGMALQGRSSPSGAATPTTMAQYDDLAIADPTKRRYPGQSPRNRTNRLVSPYQRLPASTVLATASAPLRGWGAAASYA